MNDKFIIKRLRDAKVWIVFAPNGMIYIEEKFRHAIIRMDLSAASMGKQEVA